MKRRHSLSARLLGLFLLTALLLSLVVQSGFKFGLRNQWRETAQPHLAQYMGYLLNEIGTPPRIEQASALTRRLPIEIAIVGEGGNWSSGAALPESGKFRFHTHLLPDGRQVELGWWRGSFLVRAKMGPDMVIIMPRGDGLSEGAPWAGLFTIAGVLAVLMFFYYAVRRLFRPIETIRAAVARFGEGQLDHRIRLERRDELGELAGSVDRMADDIQAMLEAKRLLLLAISHELRSPLTRARVNIELLEKSSSRDNLSRDLSEIDTLLTELLESERLSNRHAALNLSATDPMQLISDLVGDRFSDEGIELQLAASGTFIPLDTARIKLLIRNLLDNSLRHTPGGSSPPEVHSGYRDESWWLRVRDHGPGISAQHIPHVTEPFYRVDPARRRETGGFGLGLYLCRKIAEAHGGELRIESSEGVGTRIELVIPQSTD